MIPISRIVLILSLISAPCYALSIDDVRLTATDLAPNCALATKKKPARRDAQVFYDHGVHSAVLPVVFKKLEQPIRCGASRGMVYYFEYLDIEARERAEHMARTALWGDDTQASPRKPEQIFNWDKFLFIVSFKERPQDVMSPLVKKLKQLQSEHVTPP